LKSIGAIGSGTLAIYKNIWPAGLAQQARNRFDRRGRGSRNASYIACGGYNGLLFASGARLAATVLRRGTPPVLWALGSPAKG